MSEKNLLINLVACPLSTATKGDLILDRSDELVASVQVQNHLHSQKIILPASVTRPCVGSLSREVAAG